ncbi:PA14 domain-containing protein [Pontibacter ruber]|uniref:PA14 domain-containing protein n=1 Tax=Pontibacter ruber TaxID=1343895 RepID=UPI0020291B53|nr:PA14 domain-containing protein [Pontibacter ruber]
MYALTPLQIFAQTYSGPLVITKGGTYTGNWESRDSEVPAVDVRTSEPVVIVNSNIRGAGYLIKSWGYEANITVRHTNGYGLTPTSWNSYMKSRRFLTVDVFKNVVVENCYMEGTAGISVAESYRGNGTTSETIKIRYNKAKNIDGRVQGGKDLVQFVQFNFKGAIRHVEVAWNQIINEPGNSAVEDNINIYNTRGTSDSPIKIHNNYIQGAFPVPATSSTYSGGGIITDGDGDINVCPAYVEAFENHLVGLGNYSMGMAGGNNLRYHHNRAVNAATFPDGSKYAMYTSGYWSNDYYKQNTTFANSIDNNVMGIVAWGWDDNRNDISVQEFASFTSNTALPNPITRQHEADEFTRWNQKLQQNGIVLGPNGSATAVANQAPAVTLTSPSAGATFTQGAAVTLTASATDADGKVARVEFFQGTTKLGEATASPYSFTWSNVPAGSYSLTAKATDDKGATKTSAAVGISVTATTATAPSLTTTTTTTTGTGKITRDLWSNVTGEGIATIPVNNNPTSSTQLTLFEAPSDFADNYGQRIRGYVTAPATGAYTFWISGDNSAELYLSTSEDPAKKVKIASVNGWTNPREWAKYSTQQSVKVNLEAGKRYYIEALQKEEEGGDNLAVGWQLPSGTYERPIAGNRLSVMGSTATVAVTVPTYVMGKITRDLWSNVTGEGIATIPVSNKPTSTNELTLFEAPSDFADNYGQRIRGYVTAPATGAYTFWISGDNSAELYLSTSEDPAKKVKIASVNGWTNPREWAKYSTQQSVKVNLEAGKRYYIEALQKEEEGGDNLAVGWQLPSGAYERPIAGSRLSPFEGSISTLSAMSVSEAEYTEPFFTQVSAYPNPFKDVITLNFGTQEVKLQEVVILDQTGKVIYTERKDLALVNNKLELNLASAGLKAGLYILKYTDTQGKSSSIKIIKE